MPIWFSPIPGKQMFHVVYSGYIGLEDVLGFFDRFEADFCKYPNYREFCDARLVEDIAIDERELAAVLSLVIGIYRRNDCRKRIAFLAPTGGAKTVLDAVVKRFEEELPTVQSARFDTTADALNYIDLPKDYSLLRALH